MVEIILSVTFLVIGFGLGYFMSGLRANQDWAKKYISMETHYSAIISELQDRLDCLFNGDLDT